MPDPVPGTVAGHSGADLAAAPGAPGTAIAATRAVEAVMRDHRGRLLAALIARLRDFQLAEDALQDAAVSAIAHWGRSGPPASPQGWLLRVALRKAIDRLRRSARDRSTALDQAILAGEEAAEADAPGAEIPDERLRLIFTCCHPALEEKTRVALTLRSLCGLSTARVAQVFLDAEPTMGQRLSRARAKIAAARIPWAVPGPEDWPLRLSAVLKVVYLVYTADYIGGADGAEAGGDAGVGAGADTGAAARDPAAGLAARDPAADLAAEALFLARLVAGLVPDSAEAAGCLALLLLTEGRRAARRDAAGLPVPPAQQDRALWNPALLDEGRAVLAAALAQGRPGPFQIKAAIAACHARPAAGAGPEIRSVTGPDIGPDWPQIAALYGALQLHEDTPVVALNRAVALGEAQGPAAALAALAPLAPRMQDHQPFHAAKAEFLARAGLRALAAAAYDRAIALARHPGDAAFLQARRAALAQG